MTLTIAAAVAILIFLRSTLSEYQSDFKNLPDNIENDIKSILYITWQKERHKLERDIYLSFSCILS